MRSYTSTAATSVIGDASQDVFFPTKVFSLAGVRDGDVRVRSYMHEDIRGKAKLLVHVRAARSMVEGSLLTCLSSLYDVHPRLGPGAGRYSATTHLIRRRARRHRSLGMPAKFACSLVCSLPYMHEDASRRRKHSHADEHANLAGISNDRCSRARLRNEVRGCSVPAYAWYQSCVSIIYA